MANLMYTIITLLLLWLPTDATLTLTGSNSYIQSNEDFVLNCFTDEYPSIPRAFIYKDKVQIVTLTFQAGNCYKDSTRCSVTKMCDCNTRNYSLTFNGVIQNQPVEFDCRVQFPGNPTVWKSSFLTLFLPRIPTSDPSITIDPSGPIYNEGAVTMKCEVEGGIPLATVSWQCTVPLVETVTQNDDKATSTVHLTVNKTHTGNSCICKATHPLWENVHSATSNIVVYYGPESVTLSPLDTQYTVIEGSTIPSITCTTDCIPTCNYMWSGPGVPTGTKNVLSIQNINQYQRGVFNCTAYNVVGNSKSSDVNIDVQFGPGTTVQFEPSGTSVTKNKGEQVGPITCSARCNPPCQYTWTKPDTTVVYGAQLIITSLAIADHGQFICTASNTIRDSQNKSLDVTVNFKPFLDTTRSNSPEKIALSENEYLYITVSVKSNPYPIIKWTFTAQDNIDGCNNSSINSTSKNDGPNSSSNISIDNLEKNQFGQYTFMATNVVGMFHRKFIVLENEKPMSPSYVHVVCKSTTAIVIIKPILIGNLPQELFIQYAVEGQDMTSIRVRMNDTNQALEYTVTGLNPGRKYNFSILAVNLFGQTRSNQVKCLTDKLPIKEDILALSNDNSGMLSAGIATLVVGLLFCVAVTIFIFRKRFKKAYSKSSKSNEYSDLQTCNPAFQDPYTSIQNPNESRLHQESSANTYEECGNTSDAAAYQNIENMKSGHKKEEKNLGIYDNMKI